MAYRITVSTADFDSASESSILSTPSNFKYKTGMITNNFIEEMNKKGYSVNVEESMIVLEKDGRKRYMTMEKIRKIFLTNLVTHLENVEE